MDSDRYFYIGTTKYTAVKRFEDHLTEVRLGTHSNSHFMNKVRKIGENRVVVDVLQVVNEHERFLIERDYIERMADEGHPLVNRMHNDIVVPISESYAEPEELTPERYRQMISSVEGGPVKAKREQDQWLADMIHRELAALLVCMKENFLEEVQELCR